VVGARRPRPRSVRFEPVQALRDFMTPVPRVLLSGLLTGPTPSDGAGAPRLCQDCSHQPRRLPGPAVLSFCRAAATAWRWWSLASTRINSASRRTKQALQAFTIYFDGRIPTPMKMKTATITYTDGPSVPGQSVSSGFPGRQWRSCAGLWPSLLTPPAGTRGWWISACTSGGLLDSPPGGAPMRP